MRSIFSSPRAAVAGLMLTGAVIGLLVALVGLPYGRIDYRAFAEIYHGGEDTTGFVHFAIDCDPSDATTDDSCTFDRNTTSTIDVAVTISNSTGVAFNLVAFSLRVVTPDEARIDAAVINNPGTYDDNPDFNQAAFPGPWDCVADPDYGGPGSSVVGCSNGLGPWPPISANAANLMLATVHYNVVPGAPLGSVVISLEEVTSFDDQFIEVGTCNPIVLVEAKCFGATITLQNGPVCLNPDHDCDGFIDVSPPGHPGPRNTNANYDNCPVAPPNPGQMNTDGNFWDQSPPYVPAVDDLTRVNSDWYGDDCDNDIDNDGRTQDLGFGPEFGCNGMPFTDRYSMDTDGDRVHDGAECSMGSNPGDPLSKPPLPSAADDPDHDRLSTAFEMMNLTDPNDIDSDDDGLQDGWERKGHASNPNSIDTDADGIRDACEVASINADTVVNPGDQALLSGEIMRAVPPSQKIANMDLNKDGVINPGDQAFQASMIGPGKCL